jgi:hypothetical protein
MCYDASNLKRIPILISTEIVHMARPPIPLNVKDLVRRYRSGERVLDMAKNLGVAHTTIQDRLRRAGVLRKVAEDLSRYKRESMIDLPISEVIDRYLNGESANALAESYGVSRIVISKRLLDAGVLTKGTGDPLISRARTAETRGHNIGSGERWLAQVFESIGLRVRMQAAIDRYNVDILVNDTVAVELMTCTGTPYLTAVRYRQRIEYLLNRYCILVVWSSGKSILTKSGADKVATLLKKLCRCPTSARGQYWVIRGNGELACRGDDPNDISFIPTTVRKRKSRRIN